jgi:hypothetical protein
MKNTPFRSRRILELNHQPPMSVMSFREGHWLAEVATIIALLCQMVPAQAASNDEFGSLIVSREHVNWPSPESLVRDLRSHDEGVRMKALSLIGVPEANARPLLTGKVIVAEQVELRYAALGTITRNKPSSLVSLKLWYTPLLSLPNSPHGNASPSWTAGASTTPPA